MRGGGVIVSCRDGRCGAGLTPSVARIAGSLPPALGWPPAVPGGHARRRSAALGCGPGTDGGGTARVRHRAAGGRADFHAAGLRAGLLLVPAAGLVAALTAGVLSAAAPSSIVSTPAMMSPMPSIIRASVNGSLKTAWPPPPPVPPARRPHAVGDTHRHAQDSAFSHSRVNDDVNLAATGTSYALRRNPSEARSSEVASTDF